MERTSSPKLPERPEEFSALPASPYAPLFIEKLLLAVIEAHPASPEIFGVSDRAHLPAIRLQRAMHALFGTAPEPASDYDLPALAAAAKAHLLEHSNREFEKHVLGQKPGREKTPFSEAVGLAGHTQTDDPDRAQYVRLARKYRTTAYAEYLYMLVTFRHHEEEDAMARDLQVIAAILKAWTVDTDLDPEKLGMLSRTHFRTTS